MRLPTSLKSAPRSEAIVVCVALLLLLIPARAVSQAGSWSLTTPIPERRSGHTATQLLDGRVLLAGGWDFDVGPFQLPRGTSWLFDPDNASWKLAGNHLPATNAAATLLSDGRVLLTGGDPNPSNRMPLNQSQVFDPASETWSPTAAMLSPRAGHSQVLLDDGRVIAIGGQCWDPAVFNPPPCDPSVEVFDPDLDEWNALPVGGDGPSTVLADGRVLIGGTTIDPVSETSSPTTNPPSIQASRTMTRLLDGRVLIAGGGASEIFDPATDTFAPSGGMNVNRSGHRAVLLPDGRVLVAGGDQPATAEIFDLASGSWQAAASPSTPGSFSTLTALASGRILALGGDLGLAGGSGGSTIAELFSLTGTWQQVPLSPSAPPLTLLPGGRVATETHIYDPAIGVFTPRAGPPLPGGGPRPPKELLLPDGRLLRTHGYAEAIYDPAIDSWSTLAFAWDPEYTESALLEDGRVLLTGTVVDNNTFEFFNVANIYDPVTDVFDNTVPPPSLLLPTNGGGALTPLHDGRVLRAGGDPATVEIFDPTVEAGSTLVCSHSRTFRQRCCATARWSTSPSRAHRSSSTRRLGQHWPLGRP